MPAKSMEELVSLCKRRGFIFPGSDVYGGLQGTYDYGPLGTELKNNLKAAWWRANVYERDDMEGLDASILTHKLVLKYSGHETTFSDPMADCLLTKARLRADHVPQQSGTVYHFSGAKLGDWASDKAYAVLVKEGEKPEKAQKTAKQFYAQALPASLKPEEAKLEPIAGESEPVENSTRFNPENGSLLTEPRPFNLMFKTAVGPVADDNSFAYLRPETAQSIFINFKNVVDSTSRRLPFGIAQAGKSFRNEITPRNFIFRVREFEQMEIEFFVVPGTDDDWHAYWVENRLTWWREQGLQSDNLVPFNQPKEDLSHYSKATVDILYRFPHGLEELEGIANRTDFDLGSHTKAQKDFGLSASVIENTDSTAKLTIPHPETNKPIVPFVIEPSAGVDRGVLAVLTEAYTQETLPDGSERIVLKLRPHLAPIKVAVLPLARNKPAIVEQAKAIKQTLQKLGLGRILFEDTGNIGKGYRRHDEIGTPFCVTVDFDTLGQSENQNLTGTVTVRNRDTMQQERIAITDLPQYFRERLQY